MRDIDAIFAAAGEAMLPFLREAFEAGKREGRRDATEEYKAKIAAVWDQEPKENESSQPGPPAALHKLERQESERPQAKRSFSDDLRNAIVQ